MCSFFWLVVAVACTQTMVLPWMPNVDGSVVPGQLVPMLQQGKFNSVPTIFGSVKNETFGFANLTFNDLKYSIAASLIFGSNTTQVPN